MEHSKRSLMGWLRKATEAYYEGYDETRSDRKLGILRAVNLSARRINNESILYIALDGETTNLNEFTNFCRILLLIQQFVNSIKFVVLSPLRYESGRAERPRLSVIIIFVVSLIRLTDKTAIYR